MSKRFWIRGTTALACTAAISASLLSPVAAAPGVQSLSSTASLAFARPLTPVGPTDAELAKAKESQAATAAASAQLEALIFAANEKLQTSTLESMGANDDYTRALVELKQRRREAATAAAQAETAAKTHAVTKKQVGQLAGALYKNGGIELTISGFLTGSDSDDTLYQASTLLALSANRAQTFAAAESAAASSAALGAQAAEARKAAEEAAATAESSRGRAQAAMDAQAAIVAENEAQRSTLLQKLAALNNTTVELEGARVDELNRKAQEEALKEQINSSADAPAPVRPPVTAPDRPIAGPNPPVATSAPKPPVVTSAPKPPVATTPPPTTAPKPPTPTTPPPVKPTPPPVKPVDPPVAPPSGSYIQVMVNYAMSKVGGPYQWGGNGPVAFDCSGLVQQAFAAAGKSVPRQGTDQFWAAPQRVPLSQMRYGDLLVFDDNGNGRFNHIAIYIGNNQVVQALNPQQPIGVTSLSWMSGMRLYPYAARY